MVPRHIDCRNQYLDAAFLVCYTRPSEVESLSGCVSWGPFIEQCPLGNLRRTDLFQSDYPQVFATLRAGCIILTPISHLVATCFGATPKLELVFNQQTLSAPDHLSFRYLGFFGLAAEAN
jgi:hypothetical protein